MQASIHLTPKMSLLGKVFCLLNLPPTKLEWPGPFLSPFLPSEHRDQVQLQPGRLPKWLQTDTCPIRWELVL